MPERQSSPGEATAPPESEETQNGRSAAVGGTAQAAPEEQDTEAAAGPVAEGPGSGDEQATGRPSPAPRPSPRPAPQAPAADDGDESPTVRTPNGRAAEGQPANAQAPATQSAQGHAPHPPAPSSQTPSSQGPNSQGPNAQAPTVQTPNAQGPSAAVPQGQPPNGHPPQAQAPNGQPRNGHAGNGQPPVGQSPSGHPGNGRPVPAQAASAPGPRPRVPLSNVQLPESRPNAVVSGGEAPTVRAAAQRPPADQRPGEAATVAVPAAAARPSWSPADAEATQVLPRAAARVQAGGDEPATERIPLVPGVLRQQAPPLDDRTRVVGAGDLDGPDNPDGPDGPGPDRKPRRGRRRLLVLAAVIAALGVLYGADLLLGAGSVPRGVTVAGVSVGGLALADAEERLRTEIGPRTTSPVPVTAGDARGEIDPAAAGLSVDWQGTLERAGDQPLNPITRVTSFFTRREVGVVTVADPAALNGALEQLGPVVDREPVEGSVRFDGTQPQPVEPKPGQRLDVVAAADVLKRDWANGSVVALPLAELPATTTAEDVTTAIERVARPAVAAPVTVVGENDVRGTIPPDVIAASLSFVAENGDLVPQLNQQLVQDALAPQMAASERPGKNASFDFSGGRPVVVPSQDGRGVDYKATLPELLDVLGDPAPREITAIYADQPAEVTTEELQALGNPVVIGEFTTGGFAADSGLNIRRAAQLINGKVVQPGETFSLDAATGPRTAANGYVEAGVIDNGRASRGIAGGASQVSTTLYNAAYRAGMTLVEHQAHSYYISRYPAGREATIATGAIDNKFRNDNPTPVLIRTAWTPTSVTVQIYGQRQWEVTGEFGPRTNPTEPNTVTIPAGEDCHPSNGAPGFTITDTRTMRNVTTGEVRREVITTRYNPAPKVVCED